MKQIVFLGPKHSGKTTAGKVLAEIFSCDFFDLDEEIYKNTGKTPRQLYTEGQDVFQQIEVNTLRSLCLCASVRDNFVLSTGGGIIDNPEAVEYLKNADAVKVCLSISADTAWQRISASGELPPFLQTENPRETHRVLHERRAAACRQLADITIEAEGKTPEEIAIEIAEEIKSFNI